MTDDAWIIDANSSLDLSVDAKIPMQTTAITGEIVKIGFTFEVLEDVPEINCPECLVVVSTVTDQKLDCGHYSFAEDNLP